MNKTIVHYCSLNQLMACSFSLWFSFFSHWEKSKWTPGECVTKNHVQSTYWPNVLGGNNKSKYVKKALYSGLLGNTENLHSFQQAASLYRHLHIDSNLLHPRIQSIRDRKCFCSNLQHPPGRLFESNLVHVHTINKLLCWCWWLWDNEITVFTSAQTNCTKVENEPEFNINRLNTTGVKTPLDGT